MVLRVLPQTIDSLNNGIFKFSAAYVDSYFYYWPHLHTVFHYDAVFIIISINNGELRRWNETFNKDRCLLKCRAKNMIYERSSLTQLFRGLKMRKDAVLNEFTVRVLHTLAVQLTSQEFLHSLTAFFT